jgi:hypothetical protein
MLYVVECAYTDPQSEAAWNTFYNQEKLPALVSVPGFYASQRFRALSEAAPLPGAARYPRCYRHRQRRLPPQRWRPFCPLAIGDRRLASPPLSTTHALREVAPDEVLLLGDTAEDLPVAAPIVLQPGGLATRQTRYAAIVPRDDLHHLATSAAVFIYQPITARLRHPAQRA